MNNYGSKGAIRKLYLDKYISLVHSKGYEGIRIFESFLDRYRVKYSSEYLKDCYNSNLSRFHEREGIVFDRYLKRYYKNSEVKE